jgi:hypothetical protein
MHYNHIEILPNEVCDAKKNKTKQTTFLHR